MSEREWLKPPFDWDGLGEKVTDADVFREAARLVREMDARYGESYESWAEAMERWADEVENGAPVGPAGTTEQKSKNDSD